MFVDMWIGDLDDPDFKWDGGDYNNNIPKRKSPDFPHPVPWLEFIREIRQGVVEGKWTDWGGCVAKATPDELRAFIKRHYTNDKGELLAPSKTLQALYDFVDKLEPNKQYALVFAET